MDTVLWLFALFAIVAVISGPIAWIIAAKNKRSLLDLKLDLDRLRQSVGRNNEHLRALRQQAAEAPARAPGGPAGTPITDTPQAEQAEKRPEAAHAITVHEEPKTNNSDHSETAKEQTASPEHTTEPEADLVPEAANQVKNFETLENDLSSKWMIWIGGIALALGGAFIVKYSIDANLLQPSVRVTLGVLIGLILTLSGEAVRRKRADVPWLGETPDYLPAAITAAGLFTLFASLYSAYALYDLFSPLVAFGGLALVATGASGLALLQGRFLAYLGLIAGLTIPALVSTGGGNAWALFPYLLFVVAAALYVARARAWVAVAAWALGLASFWAILWIATNWHLGDGIPVGIYLLTLAGLTSKALSGASPDRTSNPAIVGLKPRHTITMIADSVTGWCFILLVSTVRLEHYSTASLILFTVMILYYAYQTARNAEYDVAALMALGSALFLLATWHLPDLFEIEQLLGQKEAVNFAFAPIAPPGFQTFVSAAVLLAGGISFALFVALPDLLRKNLWASVSASFPLLILVITYAQLENFETNLPFAAIALSIGGLLSLAVTRLNQQPTPQKKQEYTVPVAAYAAGASAAVALALTMLLRDAWLSFALALEIVALAYIWRTTKVSGLRTLALILAAIVLVRLFLNPEVLTYHKDAAMPLFNWLFYGYGLTAGLFAYAAKIFRHNHGADRLISVLTAGAVMITITFVSLEIRIIFSDTSQLTGRWNELETALQTLNWGVATTVLFWRECKDGDILFKHLRRFMTLITLWAVVFGGGLANNILIHPVDVGLLPIFNIQFLQFLLPAVLYAAKAKIAVGAEKTRSLTLYGTAAFLTFLLWLTVEVKHFHNPTGQQALVSNWEWYSYSAVWLLYAIAMLIGGLIFEIRRARMAGLGLLGVVILKVFLLDMNALDGIARALSFMGLGITLIGLGYLYQKLKQPPKPLPT